MSDHEPIRNGLLSGVRLSAVDQERVAVLSASRDELIHDATRGGAEDMLALLAAEGLGDRVDVQAVHGLEHRRGRHLERRRRGEAAAKRHCGDDRRLKARHVAGQIRQVLLDNASPNAGGRRTRARNALSAQRGAAHS